MFTYISVEEFADVVVKNNKDANRRELIASLREALAAKRNGARCMICGAPIWAAGSAITGTNMCFTCTTGEADDSEDYEIELKKLWKKSDSLFSYVLGGSKPPKK